MEAILRELSRFSRLIVTDRRGLGCSERFTAADTIEHMPRHQSATAHELARIAELAGLPGETLARLGERMERRELGLGEKLDASGRFGVVLAGMLRGGPGLLRPGDTFEGRVTAITPATVATCERAVYESLHA